MKKPKLSDWFGPQQKPTIVGVYETDVKSRRGGFYQHWDGEQWGLSSNDARRAYMISDGSSSYQNPTWRGLKEKPNDSTTD